MIPKTLLLLSLFLILSSCRPGPIPKWDGKLYIGSSGEDAIVRRNPGEPESVIRCSSPPVDEYICMSQADFKRWVATYIGGCKEWKKGMDMVDPGFLWMMVKPK